jgi:AcrR family transcriptional regulator
LTTTSLAASSGRTPSFERILEAAKALFISRGFPSTSMEAIAQQAKVVRATVYNNFVDKEAILDELMRPYILGYAEIPQRLRGKARPEQTSFELVEEMIRGAILWRIENAELRPLIDLSKHLPRSRWGEWNAAADEAMLGWITEIHRRDAERGLTRPGVDLEFALPVLYSMIEGVIDSFDVNASRGRVDEAVRQLTLLHWHALYPIEPDDPSGGRPKAAKRSAGKR